MFTKRQKVNIDDMNAHNGSEYFNNYMIEARKEFVETNTKLNK